jgi:hypothetical protein
MNKKDLEIILLEHRKYLEGNGRKKADLSNANLSYADLVGVNLRGADLSEANLCFADLSCANIAHANLNYADLSKANLSSANLRFADLVGANLTHANLRDADLSCARLPPGIYIFQSSKHQAIAADNYIRIGCLYKPVEEWLQDFKQLGKDHGYTAEEIKEYGEFIKFYAKKCKRNKLCKF